MAFNISVNYQGKPANGYISKAVLGNNTLNQELITVLPNIKHKAHLRKFDVNNILKQRTDSFSDTGSVDRTDKVLEPKDLEVNSELPVYDFEQDWQANRMRRGALNSNITADFREFVFNTYSNQVSEEIEYNIWQGDTTGSTYTVFDGFDKILSNSNSVISKTLSNSTSKSNVVSQLEGVYKDIPEDVYRKSDVAIFVPFATGKFYRQAVTSQANEAYLQAKSQLSYIDVPVVEVPLPNNTIVAGQSSNMFFGTDLLSDFNQLQLIDMRETTGDDLLRLIMKMKGGVEIAYENEVVYHSK